MTAETIRRGARAGFALALCVQLGSLIGDAIYAALAFAGLAALVQNRTFEIALELSGALFLLLLAWSSLQSARKPAVETPGHAPRGGLNVERRDAFLSGLAISLTNPWAIAFWLSLGGALASLVTDPAALSGSVNGASARQVAVFFASFMLGSVLWAIALSFAIARLGCRLRPVFLRAVSVLCGLTLAVFGLAAASHVLLSIVKT